MAAVVALGVDDVRVAAVLRDQAVRRLLHATEILERQVEDAVHTDHAGRLGAVSTPAGIVVHGVDLGDLVIGRAAAEFLDVE